MYGAGAAQRNCGCRAETTAPSPNTHTHSLSSPMPPPPPPPPTTTHLKKVEMDRVFQEVCQRRWLTVLEGVVTQTVLAAPYIQPVQEAAVYTAYLRTCNMRNRDGTVTGDARAGQGRQQGQQEDRVVVMVVVVVEACVLLAPAPFRGGCHGR
jgi:hypothetical protein